MTDSPEIAGRPNKRILVLDAGGGRCPPDPAADVTWVGSVEEAARQLEARPFHLLVTDLRGARGLAGHLRPRAAGLTVFVTAAFDGLDEAARSAAGGLLGGPIRWLADPAGAPAGDGLAGVRFHDILSQCPRMHAIFELIGSIADTTTTVLIEGETGTGKEQMARAIHAASVSRSGPMVALNCAALPETLLESELFGHEKGSFTGATAQRVGRFELARGGTLFLDEVGDVPPLMQVKLLRVLQERRFERIGGTETLEADVRVIAATNRPLRQQVARGTFREDLYYRLNVVRIDVPPLRDRPGDVPLLAAHFARKHARPGEPPRAFSPAALEVLGRYHWPGNVRELENVVERACVLSRGEVIEADSLAPELFGHAPGDQPFRIDLKRPLKDLLGEVVADVERRYILKALKKTHGHVGKAARICGYCRRSITAKIAEYHLDRSTFRDD